MSLIILLLLVIVPLSFISNLHDFSWFISNNVVKILLSSNTLNIYFKYLIKTFSLIYPNIVDIISILFSFI